MSFTFDSTFEEKPRPFSDDFHQKLRGVAADLSKINSLIPLITRALLDQGVSVPSAGGNLSFPAIVSAKSASTWDGRKLYSLQKVISFATSSKTPEPVLEDEELPGVAINLAEYEGGNTAPPAPLQDYRGTGLSNTCLNVYNGEPFYGIPELSVSSIVGQYVLATEFTQTGALPPGVNYVFHCWIPFCITCPTGGEEPMPYGARRESKRDIADLDSQEITDTTLLRNPNRDRFDEEPPPSFESDLGPKGSGY
tara:strand:- start:111 stop:866 length:756 start_codon:yes stop_codon:yes gene_type:complete